MHSRDVNEGEELPDVLMGFIQLFSWVVRGR